MRNYGKVYSRFWSSRDMRALTEDARYLALYLMTCKHCTLAGIFHLPDGYACHDMQWTPERLAEGFAELFRKGFATRCEHTDWVWITKHLEWNGLENPNQAKAAAKVLTEVPEYCCWLADFQKAFENFIESSGKPFRKGSGRVPEPSAEGSATVDGAETELGSSTIEGSETVAEGFRKGSGTVSKPVSVSVSVSGAVTVPVTVPVRRDGAEDASREDATGEHTGGGCGNSHPNLNGAEAEHGAANGQEPAEPKSFATLREIYPPRSGSHRWADALDHYRANLKAGYSHQQMLDGVMRYARYCKTEDLLGKPKVQTAATFLGPNRGFLEPWSPSTKRETPGEGWSRRRQEAKDAAR